MEITSRAQAIAAGTSAGALEIDLYREMGDEGREAAEQTAGRPWRSDSDGEAAAVLKVPQRWRPVFCAAYAKAAIKAAKQYLAEAV